MENVIVSLICIALLVVGGMTMSQGFLSSVDSSQVGLTETVAKNEDIARTELNILSVACSESSLVILATNSESSGSPGTIVPFSIAAGRWSSRKSAFRLAESRP